MIDRASSIMEFLAHKDSASLRDIYSALDMNKTSAFRIANALVRNGYLERDEEGCYSLSFKLYEIGICAVKRIEYIPFIRETLDTLSKELEVIAQFSVREQNELLCLESFDLTHSNFSVYTKVGQRSQLYSTGAGKAILSTYTDEEIKALWEVLDIRFFTHKTITDFDDFMREIEISRKRGYSLDNEETELGLFCIGAPLLNASNKAVGAISLAVKRLDDNTIRKFSGVLLNHTQRLSYMLSYSIK